ncbi:MAG: hypothetical protein QM802_11125 [Agriterribacter sp.]
MNYIIKCAAIAGILCMLIHEKSAAQQKQYLDGRPVASKRIPCKDEGIVMRYGDGKDSCDTYGAREAVVNKEGDTYYLFYDGAGKSGWLACLAESKDLRHWTKKGPILSLGDSTQNDSKSASSPWVIKENNEWHMFYVGAKNTTPAPYRIPSLPYLTMKAKSASLRGPWVKQYDVTALPPKEKSYYSITSSPGYIVKHDKTFFMFFSGAMPDSPGIKRTLGLARTNNLNSSWTIEDQPVVPVAEQIENSSVYYEPSNKTWFLFTNHVGITEKGEEYTDAIWVYWSKDINKWDANNKAVVLDNENSIWAKGAIGMPTVIKAGNKLALLYDAAEGKSFSHMYRSIGLAWMELPLKVPQ